MKVTETYIKDPFGLEKREDMLARQLKPYVRFDSKDFDILLTGAYSGLSKKEKERIMKIAKEAQKQLRQERII